MSYRTIYHNHSNLEKLINHKLKNIKVGEYKDINLTYRQLDMLGIKKREWMHITTIEEVIAAYGVQDGYELTLTKYPCTKAYI